MLAGNPHWLCARPRWFRLSGAARCRSRRHTSPVSILPGLRRPARNIFDRLRAWPKTWLSERPVLCVFHKRCSTWPPSILFGRRRTSYYAAVEAVSRCNVAVVPGHPVRRRLLQRLSVALQLGEVIERIGAVQHTSVNQAHEQIAHPRAVHCRVENSCDSEPLFSRHVLRCYAASWSMPCALPATPASLGEILFWRARLSA